MTNILYIPNTGSLPDSVKARIAVDVARQAGEESADYPFIWRPDEYKGLKRDRVRARHHFTVRLKLAGNQQEWTNLVAWAQDHLLNTNDIEMAPTTRNGSKKPGK